MKVRNINGTSQNICKCGNWLRHWEKFSGEPVPRKCSEKNCTKQPEVGAHVQKDSLYDRNWYIIPLCWEHNGKKGESIIVEDGVVLVPANVSETCGSW